nr:uncharacterized protein LOC117601642 [Osmia lignaria]
MENSGEVTIEGENYEVVDECHEEEEALNIAQNKCAGNNVNVRKQNTVVALPNDNTQNENMEQNKDVIPIDSVNNSLVDNSNIKNNVTNDTISIEDNTNDISNIKNDISIIENDKSNTENDISIIEDDKSNTENDMSNIDNDTLNTEAKYPQQSNVESIDFTADINLDQLDEQKDITDEDVLLHLKDIEDLDTSDFQGQEECDQLIDKNASSSDIEIVTEIIKDNYVSQQIFDDNKKDLTQEAMKESKTNDWYKKKLAEKETIVKERLSKVARVLGISYPCYEKWLEGEEKANGSALCKLQPTQPCRLDKPYANRWKFVCVKKKAQELTSKTNNVDADATDNKNTEAVWKLEASTVCNTNTNNEVEFPPFVLRAVKVFEEFLQTTEQSNAQNSKNEDFADDISLRPEVRKEINNEGKQEWLGLLVRCNSMDELMLFATGKNISCSTMDRLKQVYESGAGKDCNVKSLYCKSMNKCNDTVVTDTTFLVGSEALDEVVGGLKIQLAPKTNFWSNTAGAENVTNAVIELLVPTPKTTVLEIGCGIGLIGLMMASKCQQVIGIDSPSEVEEAEMTCELNNIKNASFIMGTPTEVTNKIIAAVKNRKACAVINANTNIGRATEVMTCLRKIPSLKRIVMITTLTKQSVRGILELARPMDNVNGLPFIPVMARVVDTLPVGPHFEAVILLQRRMINKVNQQWFQKGLEESFKASDSKNNHEQANEQNANNANKKGVKTQMKKNFNKSLMKYSSKKSKASLKKTLYTMNTENPVKNVFKGKRSHSPDKGEVPPKKLMKKFNKSGIKDLPMKKKKEWMTENSQFRPNPLYEKKMREPKEQTDLRERLSSNRFDTDVAQTVKEHQALLEIAKEKLSGPAPTVDVNTAKQLQNMLNMVLEQTNKLQSQLPRSVWDRIAPPENVNLNQRENKQDDPLLKGRYVQEMGSQDILITAPNKKFLVNEELTLKPIYKKHNIPPLEPNIIMPVSSVINHREERSFRMTPEQYEADVRQQQAQEFFNRSRWSEMGNIKKSVSPMRRNISPMKHRITPPERLSPKRPLLSPPRRPCSPPRRHFSPLRRPLSSMYRQRSPLKCQTSPSRRPLSPPRRTEMLLNRPMSPLRRQISPSRQQMSTIRSTMSPSRRQPSPMGRPISPPRRQIPSPDRMISSGRQELLLSRRGGSPQRFLMECPPSLSKRPQSPQRGQSSPQKYTDDWDIPSRGAIEQATWSRPVERVPQQNVWRNEKSITSINSWEQAACNERQRKSFNQEKWNAKDPIRNDTWCSNENNWSSQQSSSKAMMKETWSSGLDNRWSNASNMPGSSNENWNIRGKETFTTYKEPWIDNKNKVRWESLNVKESWKHCDKEDDLPEDAKDPWGDDGTLDFKERWQKFETATTSSTWTRDNEQQGDMWSKNKDNWQNKGSSFSNKSQWQNNSVQNVGESRWLSQNDMDMKPQSSSTWKSGNNVGSWQFQNSNFQSQRPFSTSQFKTSY